MRRKQKIHIFFAIQMPTSLLNMESRRPEGPESANSAGGLGDGIPQKVKGILKGDSPLSEEELWGGKFSPLQPAAAGF
jgi:hypothetical protein